MASVQKDNELATDELNNDRTVQRSRRRKYIIITTIIILLLVIAIAVIVYFTVGTKSEDVNLRKTHKNHDFTQLIGRDIQLPCYLKSEGKIEVIWYFNGKQVKTGGRHILYGTSLSIEKIKAEDGGEYICEMQGIQDSPLKLAVVEVILSKVTPGTGEGPHWEDRTNSLLFVAHYKHELHRWNSTSGNHEVKILPGRVGFVVPYKDGGYIVSVDRSLVHFDWDTEKIKILSEVENGTSNAYNDGKVDPKGRVWGGTYARFTDLKEDTSYLYKGSMYMMDLDNSIHRKWENISMTNGFAWSRDNRTMYYVDSIPRKVYRFDYDVDTGIIKYTGVAIDFVNEDEDLNVLGYPDGIAMDRQGMLWVACYDAAKVVRFNPITGERLRIIDFKGIARRTTSCCFGGPNHDILYVTSGGAKSKEESQQDVYAGSVFRVTGVGVQGYSGRMYQGVV